MGNFERLTCIFDTVLGREGGRGDAETGLWCMTLIYLQKTASWHGRQKVGTGSEQGMHFIGLGGKRWQRHAWTAEWARTGEHIIH